MLSDEQKKAILKEKEIKFKAGLSMLEKETGMTIGCYLEAGPMGILPRMAIIEIPNEKNKSIDPTPPPPKVEQEGGQTIDPKDLEEGKKDV